MPRPAFPLVRVAMAVLYGGAICASAATAWALADAAPTPIAPVPAAHSRQATPLPSPQGCATKGRTEVPVRTAAQLRAALLRATPGTTVRMADGTYSGTFTLTAIGTPDAPVVVCGGPGAVIDGGTITSGVALRVRGSANVVLEGFTIRRARAGLLIEDTSFSTFRSLAVTDTGEDAVRLRAESSENRVERVTVSRTGLVRPARGFGIVVGSAPGQGCIGHAACAPDRSNGNTLTGNRISAVSARAIEIFEGSIAMVAGNTLDGTPLPDTGAELPTAPPALAPPAPPAPTR